MDVEDEVHYSRQHSSRAKRCFASLSAILATALSVANVPIAL